MHRKENISMDNIFNTNNSILASDIRDWCMNNQSDTRAQMLYAKYFSKNSPRPAVINGYYFIRENVLVEGEKRLVTLKRDRNKDPHVVAKIFKIPMDKKSGYKGHITIMSYRTPFEIYNIMQKKRYRRNIKSEPLHLFMNSFCPKAEFVKNTNEIMPEDRLFLLVDKNIEIVQL